MKLCPSICVCPENCKFLHSSRVCFKQQAEAEVVPSSSLVEDGIEVEVEFEVEVGVEIGV